MGSNWADFAAVRDMREVSGRAEPVARGREKGKAFVGSPGRCAAGLRQRFCFSVGLRGFFRVTVWESLPAHGRSGWLIKMDQERWGRG